MARQQQGGIVKGGSVNPYVAQMSLQRNDARNKMREAMMNNVAAAKRNQDTIAGNLAGQQMQAAAAAKMQDKELAAKKEGKEQDFRYTKMLNEQGHEQMMAVENLRRRFDVEDREAREAFLKPTLDEMRALQQVQMINNMHKEDDDYTLAASVGEATNKSLTALTGIKKMQRDAYEKWEKEQKILRDTKNSTSLKLLSEDFRPYETVTDLPPDVLDSLRQEIPGGRDFKTWQKSILTTANTRKLSSSLNKLFTENQIPVNLDLLDNPDRMAQEVRKGIYHPEQGVIVNSILDSALDNFMEQAEALGSDTPQGKAYYNMASKLGKVKLNLMSLQWNNTPLASETNKQNPANTVGSLMRSWAKVGTEFPESEWTRKAESIVEDMNLDLAGIRAKHKTTPGFATESSPYITDDMRQNPYFMNYIKQQTGRGQKTFPDLYGAPAEMMGVDVAGEMGGY